MLDTLHTHTLLPSPFTLHPAPYTLHRPTLYTLHPATYTLQPTYTLHPCNLCLTFCYPTSLQPLSYPPSLLPSVTLHPCNLSRTLCFSYPLSLLPSVSFTLCLSYPRSLSPSVFLTLCLSYPLSVSGGEEHQAQSHHQDPGCQKPNQRNYTCRKPPCNLNPLHLNMDVSCRKEHQALGHRETDEEPVGHLNHQIEHRLFLCGLCWAQLKPKGP